MNTRKRVLPGGWYPDSPRECNREIDEFLQGFTPPTGSWKGGVVPHAGWYFSGKAATRLISTLSSAPRADRIVIYGGHLGGGNDPVVYPEDAWDTPLGPQPMDASFAAELVSKGHAKEASRSFVDNTVEVQLPIVRRFFPEVPLIAVHAPASERALDLAGGVHELLESRKLSAVFIGSADLTHYGPNYGFMPRGAGPAAVQWVKEENDRSLIDKAVAMDAKGLLEDARAKQNTCSAGPIAAVISSVSRLGVKQGKLLEYYTSYDVMPNASFVGYSAIVY